MIRYFRYVVGSLCLTLFAASPTWAQAKLVLDGVEKLPAVSVDGEKTKIHVQGLFVTDKHYLVTGRLEKLPKRSLLIRFVRGSDRYEVLDITKQIDGNELDHPGGFDQDTEGTFWIPVSTSHRRGPTMVCGFSIDAAKPLAATKLAKQFKIDDHVGAICCRPDGVILTANWDTKLIAAYRSQGENIGEQVFQIKQETILFEGKPMVAVQDWKYFPRKLLNSTSKNKTESVQEKPGPSKLAILGGLDKAAKKQPAIVVLVNMFDGKVLETHRLDTPEGVKRPVTNEGLHYYEGELYLLPEDLNAGAKVLRYNFQKP